MPELKLARLPDRTPIKLTVTITPDLNQALVQYAAAYASTYGREEPITELVPAILAAFLDGDREFAKRRKTAE
jgi:hypothetical protein